MYKIFKDYDLSYEGLVRCKWCKKAVHGFRDLLSVREYTVSLLCQKCQDFIFGNIVTDKPHHYDIINTQRKKGERS